MATHEENSAQTAPQTPATSVPTATIDATGDGGKESVSSRRRQRSLFDRKILWRAIIDSFLKLNPRVQARNPVMFVVEIGSVITTIEFVRAVSGGPASEVGFTLAVAIWLWFTVLFANFAEAMAEGRGKAQADTLRRARTETMAKLLKEGASGRESPFTLTPAPQLRKGHLVLVEAGDVIPGDGEVVEGVASVPLWCLPRSACCAGAM